MKKWLLGGGIGVLVLAMLAGDGLAVLEWTQRAPAAIAAGGSPGGPAAGARDAARREDPPLPPKPLYLAQLPKFVAVLTTDGSGDSTYAEIAITFSSYDHRAVDKFQSVLPIIQAAIVAEVMQDGSALATGDETARTTMTHQALLAVNHILDKTAPSLGTAPFGNAYLTDFLIQ
jgi:flagellar basal body-associated protein FliL